MGNKIWVLFFYFCCTSILYAQTSAEMAANKYLNQLSGNPKEIRNFLLTMPKGGDLHNHAAGSSMAEHLIAYANGDYFCVDRANYILEKKEICAPENYLEKMRLQPEIYKLLIDAWSMHDFTGNLQQAHDHFFQAFSKYGVILPRHGGEILSEIKERAGQQRELYLELMVTPDFDASGLLGKRIGWEPDLKKFRQKLFDNHIEQLVTAISQQTTRDEQKAQKLLNCKRAQEKKGCEVEVRYLYQVFREQPLEQVFAQLLTGFELVSRDHRFVGINMVQPEDGPLALHDYNAHMHMIQFLHRLYPQVQISLHAGELVPSLVPDKELLFHIHDAIEIAGAKRIGHGVDIAKEKHSEVLLKKMAEENILVEINLISNQLILGVNLKNHPILLYKKFGVPFTLSTDDEGVLRTTLTDQYFNAQQLYHFSYSTLKNIARNSLYFSFLEGENLWLNASYQHLNPVCAPSWLHSQLDKNCSIFLQKNVKARLQWNLEQNYKSFEQQIEQHKMDFS